MEPSGSGGPVALGDLLAVRGLGLVPVIDERRDDPLRWVATSELPDPAPFLEGGEVLLSTGLETAGWRREWDGYVRRLAAAGVVAIGLGVGLTHAHSPAELVRACRRHGVDLFEVPRETAFVRISRAAAALLQRQEDAATRAALAAQRALTQAALREDEPGALLAEVARIGQVAVVVDAEGRPVLGPVGERADLLDQEALAAAVVRMRPQGLRAAQGLTTPAGSVAVHPLGVRGRPGRYLAVGFAGRVTEQQRASVATAVILLSLAEERRRAGRESDRRLRSRAVELLVAGDLRTATLLLGSASGRQGRLPRRATVVRVAGAAAQLDDALERLEAAGALAAVSEGAAPELVVVVRAAEAVELASSFAGESLRVGIGEASAAAGLAESHRTAGDALALTTPDARIVAWEDGVRRGVLSLLDDRRAAAFGAAYLAPLADDPALLDTLQAFLRHHGSLLRVADDLQVHRNTVRHRVSRIEQLLGRSLADPQVRVDAWVALQSRAVVGSMPPP
ncbi:PucR family transcriptional regulator [Nocardioides gansuensis]|uniref:PucR family transcriptional regulator n=1 Tax=Nocardioides gansuensis TaxID=2138300 RepID=A0A2T8F8A1_9ACTN|nr:PucR family transcriptional regulator [Nocardioides gansuensis]PVG81929.1 PucR family transcriptional regulator [Nocardioides gansuensis]